jgi:hypothetical protein
VGGGRVTCRIQFPVSCVTAHVAIVILTPFGQALIVYGVVHAHMLVR